MSQVQDVLEVAEPAPPPLSPQQLRFFELFGFLTLPGYLADEIDEITQAFEEVFAAKSFLQAMGMNPPDAPWLDSNFDLHFGKKRVTIPLITDRHERLRALADDPRMTRIVDQVVPGPWEPTGADGNLFYCDTSWHVDSFMAPLRQFHVKLSMYLDPLDRSSGAIRVMPGTNFPLGPYGKRLLPLLDDPELLEETLGVAPEDLPSHTVETRPGDVVLWNYRLVHAAFAGGDRRRLLSLNYRQVLDEPASDG